MYTWMGGELAYIPFGFFTHTHKLATVNFQMDNSGTLKLDCAKPFIVNENEIDLAPSLS